MARGSLVLRGRTLEWGTRTYVMGVVNITPDSFSQDGTSDPDEATAIAIRQRDAGSDMLDFGAESTRPGHQPIDEAIELARLVPVLERFRAGDKGTIVSIDTFKPAVFRRAHAKGGDILNSIWGLDDALLERGLGLRRTRHHNAQ